jgi:transcriptional regulator with XRE-family HTH domain
MKLDGVGVRLREERERLGLNQEQLGAVAGTNRMTPSRYELGSHLPTLGFLAAVEEVGVDVDYVINGKRCVVALGSEDASLVGGAVAVVEDLLKKHNFAPSSEVRGRLVLQVLVDAARDGRKAKAPSLDQLIAEMTA